MPKQPKPQATATIHDRHGVDQHARRGRDGRRDQHHPQAHQPLPVRLQPRPRLHVRAQRPGHPAAGEREPGQRRRQPALGDQHQRHEGLGGDEGPGGDPAQQHDGRQPARRPVRAARAAARARAGTSSATPAAAGQQREPGADPGPRTGAARRRRRRPARAGSRRSKHLPRAAARARRVRRQLRSAGSITASGRTTSTGIPRNTQRQPSCSVTVPAASGPTIDGTTQPAANAAMIDGPQPLRIGPADDHVQRDDHQPAAEPLHGPARDEHPHRAAPSRTAAAPPRRRRSRRPAARAARAGRSTARRAPSRTGWS